MQEDVLRTKAMQEDVRRTKDTLEDVRRTNYCTMFQRTAVKDHVLRAESLPEGCESRSFANGRNNENNRRKRPRICCCCG